MRRILMLGLLVSGFAASSFAASDDDKKAVIQVVTDAYINGVHAKPDAAAMRRGFHPDFRMLVFSDGKMTAVTLDEWAARIEKSAANPAAARPVIKSEFPHVDVVGSAASVRVEVWRDGRHTFSDYLLLYKFADGWKIVSKTFYSHAK
jgi:ketosteroid isomerase-like protein